MRDSKERFDDAGVDVVVIGMGRVEQANYFKESYEIPFRLLVDRKRNSYSAIELGRGSVFDVAGPRVWGRGAKSVARHGQGKVRQDPFQLGGVAAIEAGGRVALLHRSRTSSDNLPIDDILGAF